MFQILLCELYSRFCTIIPVGPNLTETKRFVVEPTETPRSTDCLEVDDARGVYTHPR